MVINNNNNNDNINDNDNNNLEKVPIINVKGEGY